MQCKGKVKIHIIYILKKRNVSKYILKNNMFFIRIFRLKLYAIQISF